MNPIDIDAMIHQAKSDIGMLSQLAKTHLAELERKNEQVTSLALMAAQYVKNNDSEPDPITENTLNVISNIAGDSHSFSALAKLLSAINSVAIKTGRGRN
ncbi:hypothetical protein [Herbaspirillum sp. NPDC087042]|uniref:hypothetical protein n=1 Tax=Herbaspirillum sp. NPDC087042 TaxID=3364004 RepID=UPI00380702B4